MRTKIGVGAVVMLAAGGWIWGQNPAGSQKLDQRQRIIQALNRLSWGIAPGEVDAVQKIGLQNWIELQLHPNRLPENPQLKAALAGLDTLRMTPGELLRHYPSPALIRQMAMGRRALPSEPQLRAVVETEIAAYRRRTASAGTGHGAVSSRAGPRAEGPQPGKAAQALTPEQMAAVRNLRQRLRQMLGPEQARALTTGAPRDRVATFDALPEATRQQVLAILPRRAAIQMAAWLPAADEHLIAETRQPQQVVTYDLTSDKLLRAIYTNRQLEDVLTDFWFNHFNVYIGKGLDRELITSYERDAIRPHVLGKFSDLLLATAKSPAMLFFLDNWRSVDPNAAARLMAQRQAARARRARFGLPPFLSPVTAPRPQKTAPGLNENYGREVMELHTVGLHYTQQDVIAVARCFTGWTMRNPQVDPEFYYNDRLHDKGAKVVLGVKIPAGGGMSDGLKVIQILSRSPDTAHHISYELAQRFVADDPPPALVDRMAATFLKTDGDLRQVMEAMINSPEFWQTRYYRDQVKSPLEMVVSAVRAMGAQVTNPSRLVQAIAAMGEPLYAKEPPSGYGNDGAAWVSSSGLIARMNFSLQLARNQVPGVEVDLSRFATGEARLTEVEQNVFRGLLDGQISPSTVATIEREVAAPEGGASGGPATPAQIQEIAGLVLGSPDFQRR